MISILLRNQAADLTLGACARITDLQNRKQVLIPQIKINLITTKLRAMALNAGELLRSLQQQLKAKKSRNWWKVIDVLMLRLPESGRDLASLREL